MAKIYGVASVAAVMVLVGSVSVLAAPPGSCDAVITACGCTIKKPGIYTVANDLTADQTSKPVCIEIQAAGAILNLKGFALIGKGNGTGTGILIAKGADHVIVEGGDEAPAREGNSAPVEPTEFPSAQGVVTQWNIGIQDDADSATIELFKDIGGNIFQQDHGNTTAGVLLNGVKDSSVADFQANYNGQAGVIVRDSSDIRLSNFSVVGNHESGVWLDSSDSVVIGPATAAGNTKYGMWLLSSAKNEIFDCNGTAGNGRIGILLGCGSKCNQKQSDNNRITNAGASGNGVAGILIEKGNRGNIITVTHNGGNPDNSDMVDNNPHCDSNVWYNNTGSRSQDCIQ